MIAAQEPNDSMLVAGGTDVYPNMKRQQYEPKTLVGLRQLRELRTLTGNAQHGLSIGAGMTLTQVSEQREIVNHCQVALLQSGSGLAGHSSSFSL